MTLEDLLHLDRAALASLLAQGHPIDVGFLENHAFNGVSLGLPKLVERLTWTKFKKVFVRTQNGLDGYNEAVLQTPLHEPWITKTRRGAPVRYGPFTVRTNTQPLLIDYGPPAGRFDPMRFVRDPLVSLTPGCADLLLGMSYLRIGRVTIPTPSWFALMPGAAVHLGADRAPSLASSPQCS